MQIASLLAFRLGCELGCTTADLYLGEEGFSWGCVKLEFELSLHCQPGLLLNCSHGAIVWGILRAFCVFPLLLLSEI